MSLKAMTWVWDHSPTTGTELLMLLAIADVADDHGRNAWPSIPTLAAKTRLDPRTVRRVIGRLETGGHLVVARRSGRGQTNRYTLVMNHPIPVDNPVGKKGAECPEGKLPGGASARGMGAQLRPHDEGTAAPPEPPVRPLTTTPAASTAAGASGVTEGGGGTTAPEALAVLDRLSDRWPLSPAHRARLAPGVAAALAAGWSGRQLAEVLGANADGVRSPFAVLQTRLAELPPPAGTRPAAAIPDWCGRCDGPEPARRYIQLDDHHAARCPRCHPLARATGPPDHELEEPGRPKPPSTHRPGPVPAKEPLPREEHPQCPAPPQAS